MAVAMTNNGGNEAGLNSSLDRRRILKAVGAVGIASTSGIASSATATSESGWESVSPEQVEQLKQSPQITNIDAELNGLSVAANNTVYQRAAPQSGNGYVDFFRVETQVGNLVYFETNTGSSSAAVKINEDSREHLPDPYSQLPKGTEPVLVGRLDGAVLRRKSTEAEHRAVARRAGVDHVKTISVVDTSVGGYIIERDDEGPREALNSETGTRFLHLGDAKPSDFVIPFHSRSNNAGDVMTMSEVKNENISTAIDPEAFAGKNDKCSIIVKCATCVTAVIGNCKICAGACAGVTTPPGMVTCVLCIKALCEGASLAVCVPCFECLGEHT